MSVTCYKTDNSRTPAENEHTVTALRLMVNIVQSQSRLQLSRGQTHRDKCLHCSSSSHAGLHIPRHKITRFTRVKKKLFLDQDGVKNCKTLGTTVCENINKVLIIPLDPPNVEILAQTKKLPVLYEYLVENVVTAQDPAQDLLRITNDKNKNTRKRRRQPELWERNIRKRKREGGEEFIDINGKLKLAKIVQPGCENTCKLMCSSNFPPYFREKIKSNFYEMTDAQKSKYYSVYTKRIETGRKRTKQEKSRRKYTFQYSFPKEKEMVRVCKTFFCSTLAISVRRIYYFHSKLEKNDLLVPPTPGKGKFIKKETPAEKIDEVIHHIKSFPIVESHYCRASSSRQYLQSGLSVAKMYALYLEKHKNPVKENIYRKIFCEKFNLSFHRPKKDVCDFCSEFKAQKNPNCDMTLKYEQHLKRKTEGNDERTRDRNLKNSHENNTAVATFDLQNIFSLPKANISCFFYTSKLTVYNLTAHCDINKCVINAFWDETKNGRSGDDLASALIKIIEQLVSSLPDKITNLILWSDSCVPQNRNSHMSTALLKFLLSDESKNITSITQKFSEPGHSNVQEVDTVHSIIERNLRHQEIYSPLSLLRSFLKIKSNAFRLTFLQMQDCDFLSYHKEAIKYGFHQIPYTRIKSITYSKPEWYVLKYQTSFLGPTETVDIRKKKITILNEITLKEANKTLTKKKIEDLRSMYKYMPQEDKVYMEALIRKAENFKVRKENLGYIEPKHISKNFNEMQKKAAVKKGKR